MTTFIRYPWGGVVAALASLLLGLSPLTQAQTPAPAFRSSLVEDLARTFGFCLGQHYTLDQLRREHPEMQAQVKLAEMKWNLAFEKAEAGVEARLKEIFGEKWEGVRASMHAQMEPALKQQNSGATPETIASFLQLVEKRSTGVIESANALEMLLSSDPRFVQAPEQEMARGFIGRFTTKDHPKAKGLELNLRHPLSWKKEEAERPNIVQKWTSDGGHGTDVFMLQVRRFPAPLTAEEKAEVFSEAMAKELFGAGLLSYTTSTLERMPVGISHFTNTAERLDFKLESRGVSFHLVFQDVWISLQFMCYTPGGAEAREARIKQLDPLIKMIAGSLVLPGSY